MRFRFFQNTSLVIIELFPESKHCPASSECRKLIDKNLKKCHKQIIATCFDVQEPPCETKCQCCYPCIRSDADDGCLNCIEFLNTFLPRKTNLKLSKSVTAELKQALHELFKSVSAKEVKVEDDLVVSCDSFLSDFLKMIDEVKTDTDIVKMWHIKPELASSIFATMNEVLYADGELSSEESSGDESEDVLDESSESSEDEVEDVGFDHLHMYDN